MTQKFWTQDLIDQVLTALKANKTVPDALQDVYEMTGKHLTYSQVRHAFKRFDLDTPATYLGRGNPTAFIEKLSEDMELLTRPSFMGGVGASQSNAQQQLEQRLGIPLDYIDEELSVDIKEATRDLIDERERRKALRIEARSMYAMQDRLADLHGSMRKALKYVKRNHTSLDFSRANNSDDHFLFVPLADMHVGKKHVDRFGNTVFNKQILRQRMNTILNNVVRQIEQDCPAEIIVWVAGDLFEALLGNMRKGQAQKMEMFTQEAFLEARSLLVSFIKAIREFSAFEGNISLLLTAGNHDRLTEEKEYSSEDFMMFMFADSIQHHLPDVEVHALAPICTLVVNSVELMLLHGHRNRLTNENAIHALVNNQGMTQHRKLIMQGHYHNLRWLSAKNWDCVTLPSICGNDDFTQYDINKYGEAKHCMFLIQNGFATMAGPYLL